MLLVYPIYNRSKSTKVTDLLVLLLFHSQSVQIGLYFRSGKSKDTRVYHKTFLRRTTPSCLHMMRYTTSRIGFGKENYDPEVGIGRPDWGWLFADILKPTMTEQDPAPHIMLKIIHCQCTTAYLMLRCSCKQ